MDKFKHCLTFFMNFPVTAVSKKKELVAAHNHIERFLTEDCRVPIEFDPDATGLKRHELIIISNSKKRTQSPLGNPLAN
ncbi:unnamed protein product [Leptidea sinapis]|uniref:Uncharacterized protein n=1 Tax=Leptidea sinapis TaxID=189913 RepID=A0A5E4QLW3_9NEOP|nr:unnamed protein product [Leptidea sinapis]